MQIDKTQAIKKASTQLDIQVLQRRHASGKKLKCIKKSINFDNKSIAF